MIDKRSALLGYVIGLHFRRYADITPDQSFAATVLSFKWLKADPPTREEYDQVLAFFDYTNGLAERINKC